MSPRRSDSFIRLARVVWTLVPVTVLVSLAIADLVPSGQLAVSAWPVSSLLLRGPVPEQRVSWLGSGPAAVSGFQLRSEPVYIDVRQSRPFRTVAVQLDLDPGSARLVELGLSPEGQSDRVVLQAGYHQALESLEPSGWMVKRSGGLTLFQRRTAYASVEDFLRHPPEVTRVALYRVPFALAFTAATLPLNGPAAETDFILTGYQPGGVSSGWRTVGTTFVLTPAHQAADNLRLVVSVPERPLPATPVAMQKLRLTLSGERISRRVLSGWFSQWFNR